MTAEQIRKVLADRESPERGSLEWVWLAFACEIAAQLAEMNEKRESKPVIWSEIAADGETLKHIEKLAMQTCNSERDLAICLETIRAVFYERRK